MKQILTALCSVLVLSATAQITRHWAATYNGSGDFNDRYTCMASDTSGNIYLGGSTMNPGDNKDQLIVKLNSAGVVQWRKEFNWSGNGADEVLAITVNANNLFVTGYAFVDNSVNTSSDYLTIKMNLSGDTIWTRTYNYNVASAYDQANSVFVDAAGNVYVTGISDNDSTALTNDDYATVMYSASGTEQWVQRFNGLGNATDQAEKVVADNVGNVYVTGRSDNGTDDDYVTIKYNSAGTRIWIKYDDRGGRDRATAMAIDAKNNIYITGRSDNGTNDDFWTLKYNSAGVRKWAAGAAFDFVDDDRATAMTVDINGNVYVTGQSDVDVSALRNWNYQTVKYDSFGTQIWAKTYEGTVSQDDIANAIAVDKLGNVYVTGQSDGDVTATIVNNIATVGYNASGTQLFASVYAGTANQEDAGRAVISTSTGCAVAGYTQDAAQMESAIAISYSTAGSKNWQEIFDGIGDNNDNVRSVEIDASNNVYLAGYSVERRADRNMALVKYSATGSFICKNTLDGTANGSQDDVQAIVLDDLGNPVIAGSLHNKGESFNGVITKTDGSTCANIWTTTYDAPAHGADKIYDMVRDAGGNLYVTGRVDGDPSLNSNQNCFTAKLDPSGAIIWSQAYNSGSANEDRGLAIRLASSGNVYVVGRTWNGTDYDILMLKYNNAGVQQWIRNYHGGNGNDEPKDIVLDATENFYITGISEEVTSGVYDFVSMKYNASGVQQWVTKYNGAGNGNDLATGIALDTSNNVVVVGETDADPTSIVNRDIAIVKYDITGSLSWVKTYNGVANTDDAGDDVAIDAFNRIYVTGHTNKSSSISPNYDVITMIYSADSVLQWSDIYNGTSDSSDVPNLLVLHGNDFYVAGSSVEGNQMKNMLVIKYSSSDPVNNIAAEKENNDFQVFPNPFMHSFNVISSQEVADFELHNSLGEIIFKTEIKKGENKLAMPEISSGVYFYQIRTNNLLLSTGKIIHF